MAETEDERARRLLTRQEAQNLPKRFYEEVSVAEASDGYEVRLDGRAVKTPLKKPFYMTSEAMADAVAAEWQAQETHINPATMIITRLANTAIDRVKDDEQRIVDEITGFAGSDLVCYRADSPEKLIERQSAVWDPILTWVKDAHSAQFICIAGVMHSEQPPASLQAVAKALLAEDPFRLTAIHNLTTLTGSALLAMMTAADGMTADDTWAAAHVDEDWQIEQWGEDEEAQARRAIRKTDFDATIEFLRMC